MSLFPLSLLLSTIAFHGTLPPGSAFVPNASLFPSQILHHHGCFLGVSRLATFRRRRRARPNYSTPSEHQERDIDSVTSPIHLEFGHDFEERKYSHMDNNNGFCPSSHIVNVRSNNFAGMMASNNDNDDDGTSADICVDFGSEHCFVAVTGESGTGKSLLISKAIDLLSGGKAAASLVPQNQNHLGDVTSSSSVELTVKLYEPHLSAVSSALQSVGLDPSNLFQNKDDDDAMSDIHSKNTNKKHGQLHAKRILQRTDTGRLKSTCRINNKHLSLKSLRKIIAPLFTLVDVGIASTALGSPASRLAMIDMGVSDEVISRCRKFREEYKAARRYTSKLKRDLESRVLPPLLERRDSFGRFDKEQLELLEHWIDELDEFETRIKHFCDMILNQYNELLTDEYSGNVISGRSRLISILDKLKLKHWIEKREISGDSSLFSILLEFREEVKSAEAQLVSAQAAYDRLYSSSSPDAAVVALENVRSLLYHITRDDSGPLFDKVEETHELLNAVETSLNKCARSIDGNSDSLVSMLEKMICTGISMEMIDGMIADWNSLARKHGIPPDSLPNCHASLRDELDGNVEALNKLPEAEKAEQVALDNFSSACRELTNARKDVASALSQSVSDILPVLGLEGTSFWIKMKLRQGGFEKPYYGFDSLGVDLVDFLLLHKKDDHAMITTGDELETDHENGGNIEIIGSSGEKSRVLLAIETVLPGSIGSTCNGFNRETESENDSLYRIPPISVIYDEIDAHVGGRAAVTIAKLLAGQSRKNNIDTLEGATNYGVDSKTQQSIGKQIIAITHSASVAAIADRHVVVERLPKRKSSTSSTFIQTRVVNGASRRKEIARMASGDLVPGEAEAFADALIRDSLNQKESFTLDPLNLRS